MSRGERLVIAEGDYIKPLLARRFEKVILLKNEVDEDPVKWFSSAVEKQIELKCDSLVDFGES
jgi:hypothetical protein